MARPITGDGPLSLTGTIERPLSVVAGRLSARVTILGLAVLAVLVRLPLFGVPLDSDEGGYAYVAHRWAQGGHLYVDPWVDRPQGLMIVFRALTDVSYSVTAIRVGSVIAGLVLTLAAASAAWAISGQRAAVAAGVIVAIVGAGSFLEGYEFNGELIGSAVGTTGVALALWWRRGVLSDRWLYVAGVACATAPLMKQSLLDASVAFACIVVAARRRTSWPAAIAGLATPVIVAALWGWRLGWARWTYAVLRFQFERLASHGVPSRGYTIVSGAGLVTIDLVGLAIAAGVALAIRRRLPDDWPLLAWLVAAVLCTCSGTSMHPHYWVQVVAPLGVLVGTASGSRLANPRALVTVGLVAIAIVLPLGRLVQLTAMSPSARAEHVVPKDDQRRLAQADIAQWIDENTGAQDSVYALVAGADLYLRANRQTAFPYLWLTPFQHVPGAGYLLRRWLSGDSAPQWIVIYNSPQNLDPTGTLAGILNRNYRQVAVVDGHPILRLTN